MSKALNDLCCSLIEEFYGSFHAILFSHLAYHGRLSAPQLAQRSHLPLRQVKAGLSALVQSRLLWHHTASEGTSTYQANTRTTYDLLRTGRLIELARHRLGDLAATVISSAFILGFASVAELEAETMNTINRDRTNTTNNDSYDEDDAQIGQRTRISTTIKTLTDEGYLSYVRSAHFQTTHDARQDAELHLRNLKLFTSTKGKKSALEIEERVDVEFDWRTSNETKERGYIPETSSAKSRPLDEVNGQPNFKRRKVNGDASVILNGCSGYDSMTGRPDHAVLVCVSSHNLILDVRNAYLAGRAKRSLGEIHSQVLASALSQIPSTRQWTREYTDYIDLSRIQDDVNRSAYGDLSSRHRANGQQVSNGVHSHVDNELDEEKISYNQVDRSLALLADGEFRFLRGSYGKEWDVVKREMDSFIREHEVLRLMDDRLAAPALRIVRMLMENGKLDEKTLQEIGLLSAKDLRQTLAELKQIGYIDLQEVPREAQRQPNRTIYLWFHDPERVQKVILNSLYTAMARLTERLKMERERLSSTLEKLDRSDVRGNEEEIMSTAELRVLRRWQRTERWILAEVARLDDSVILLRDL